jgi:hypothetical protein
MPRRPGTAFWELVVLPTFAPNLARPYRVPGTDKVYNQEYATARFASCGRRGERALKASKTQAGVFFLHLVLTHLTFFLPNLKLNLTID